MIGRSSAVLILALLLAACGGGAPATTGPGANPTAPPGATAAPPAVTPAPPGGATQAPGGPGTGDFESVANALLPPGATVISRSEIGGAYQLIAGSNSSMADLEAFYTQQIQALGLTETGRFEMENTLIIALTNPDGGILIVPGSEQGQLLITISLGTSS